MFSEYTSTIRSSRILTEESPPRDLLIEQQSTCKKKSLYFYTEEDNKSACSRKWKKRRNLATIILSKMSTLFFIKDVRKKQTFCMELESDFEVLWLTTLPES